MKLTDLATAKLTTLKGLWIVRQKDTELYLSEYDLPADVVDVSNEHALWLTYPSRDAACMVVCEIAAAETTIVTRDPQYQVTEYEAIPLEQVAELEYDLTHKGVLTHRVVGLERGNGPLKVFLKSTLKGLHKSRKRWDRKLKRHKRELDAERAIAYQTYNAALKKAEQDHKTLVKETNDDAALDDKLIARVEHLLNPPAKKRPLARSMTQKKAAARRGATGKRKAKGGKKRGRK